MFPPHLGAPNYGRPELPHPLLAVTESVVRNAENTFHRAQMYFDQLLGAAHYSFHMNGITYANPTPGVRKTVQSPTWGLTSFYIEEEALSDSHAMIHLSYRAWEALLPQHLRGPHSFIESLFNSQVIIASRSRATFPTAPLWNQSKHVYVARHSPITIIPQGFAVVHYGFNLGELDVAVSQYNDLTFGDTMLRVQLMRRERHLYDESVIIDVAQTVSFSPDPKAFTQASMKIAEMQDLIFPH